MEDGSEGPGGTKSIAGFAKLFVDSVEYLGICRSCMNKEIVFLLGVPVFLAKHRQGNIEI